MARGTGGELVLRIEDTDRERSTDENIAQILDALTWLGIDWDEGPVSQFERAPQHQARLQELLDSGRAYHSTETGEDVQAFKRENPGRGFRGTESSEPGAAVRLRVPEEGETVVEDAIRGPIPFENALQDDLVIARGDGTVLYNFAVAVDDAEMGISDVVRGDDHISNTPKQLLVLEALGFDPPRYAHLPLLHGPDGKKLSKRHGAASTQELREAGYLPEAVRNYLALLGWGTDDDTTLLSTAELVERFDIADVGRSSAIFDEQKLRWINGRYMREAELSAYEGTLAAHLARTDPAAAAAFEEGGADLRAEACEIVRDKAQVVTEVWPLIAFLFLEPDTDEKAWSKVMKPKFAEPLGAGLAALESVPESGWNAGELERVLREVMEREEAGPRALLQPIRVAISGTSVSPGIFESLAALGRERSLRRIGAALQRLRAEAAHEDAQG